MSFGLQNILQFRILTLPVGFGPLVLLAGKEDFRSKATYSGNVAGSRSCCFRTAAGEFERCWRTRVEICW